ncbi:MAG: hypothetical protein UU12_C0029G0015 [Candidatus Woesebacteria bacterium GW2011_GWA2_40_7b]|uniref:DUF4870 domain-containing protein n=1 Tax=Candidatus Woesebacteria bacterium GW2011_GWA2_40_7b TaxID=1618563 RepID=A0A0G0SZE2_9BACT|nr:MAG: hypothetical protein UU12_C0029G0015 [Candidatus Woesebacteria bacterium GW2011_GWA2_40_7b]
MAGTGLKKETAAALATLLGPTLVVPVLFILLEKDEFVRFWAFQSIVVYLVLFALNWVLIFTIFLAILTPLVFVFGVVLWLVMTYKAWQGDKWVVPVLGKLAVKLMNKA